MRYFVSVPVSGRASFEVRADSIEEAKEAILCGEWSHADYDDLEPNRDLNTFVVEEID